MSSAPFLGDNTNAFHSPSLIPGPLQIAPRGNKSLDLIRSTVGAKAVEQIFPSKSTQLPEADVPPRSSSLMQSSTNKVQTNLEGSRAPWETNPPCSSTKNNGRTSPSTSPAILRTKSTIARIEAQFSETSARLPSSIGGNFVCIEPVIEMTKPPAREGRVETPNKTTHLRVMNRNPYEFEPDAQSDVDSDELAMKAFYHSPQIGSPELEARQADIQGWYQKQIYNAPSVAQAQSARPDLVQRSTSSPNLNSGDFDQYQQSLTRSNNSADFAYITVKSRDSPSSINNAVLHVDFRRGRSPSDSSLRNIDMISPLDKIASQGLSMSSRYRNRARSPPRQVRAPSETHPHSSDYRGLSPTRDNEFASRRSREQGYRQERRSSLSREIYNDRRSNEQPLKEQEYTQSRTKICSLPDPNQQHSKYYRRASPPCESQVGSQKMSQSSLAKPPPSESKPKHNTVRKHVKSYSTDSRYWPQQDQSFSTQHQSNENRSRGEHYTSEEPPLNVYDKHNPRSKMSQEGSSHSYRRHDLSPRKSQDSYDRPHHDSRLYQGRPSFGQEQQQFITNYYEDRGYNEDGDYSRHYTPTRARSTRSHARSSDQALGDSGKSKRPMDNGTQFSESKRSRSPLKMFRAKERPESPTKESSHVPDRPASPSKRSRSPRKKLWGPNGWLGASMEEANDIKDLEIKTPVAKEKKTLISKLRDKLGDLAEKADLSPTRNKSNRPPASPFSLLHISVDGPAQAHIFMETELIINTTANDFLMYQFANGNIDHSTMSKVQEAWKAKGRIEVSQFRYDQETQRILAVANQDKLYIPAGSGPAVRPISLLLQLWKTVSFQLTARVFFNPDGVLRKLIADIEIMLRLLGAGSLALERVKGLRAGVERTIFEAREKRQAKMAVLAGLDPETPTWEISTQDALDDSLI